MIELTSKKYQQLPEIMKKKEEQQKKEKQKEDHEKRKEKVRELHEVSSIYFFKFKIFIFPIENKKQIEKIKMEHTRNFYSTTIFTLNVYIYFRKIYIGMHI